MLHLINDSQDPCFNLAFEEYFLTLAERQEDLVILWRNRPTVVIGRNQDYAAEINEAFIADHDIRVVRRLSGGGAVYHDLGNLNFTFITAASGLRKAEFERLTLPVIAALAQFGIVAEFTGRNDLTIDGQKFSGNAQYLQHGRLLHHGTLLFDTDLAMLSQALNGPGSKHGKRAVASVRSAVTTIKSHLPPAVGSRDFEDALLQAMFASAGESYRRHLPSADELKTMEALAVNRYRSDKWTKGTAASYNRKLKRTFAGGTLELQLQLEGGRIHRCKFCGDFFAAGEIDELERALQRCAWTREAVAKILVPWLTRYPIVNIPVDDLLEWFFEQA